MSLTRRHWNTELVQRLKGPENSSLSSYDSVLKRQISPNWTGPGSYFCSYSYVEDWNDSRVSIYYTWRLLSDSLLTFLLSFSTLMFLVLLRFSESLTFPWSSCSLQRSGQAQAYTQVKQCDNSLNVTRKYKERLSAFICKYPRFSNTFAESEHLHNSTIPFLNLMPKYIVGGKKKKKKKVDLSCQIHSLAGRTCAIVGDLFHSRHFDMS